MVIDGVMAGMRGGAGQAEARGGVAGARELGGAASPDGAAPADGADFATTLERALDGVSGSQRAADGKALALVGGEDVAVHDVMATLTEAELQVQLTTAVAAKAIAVYQEIWRMDV